MVRKSIMFLACGLILNTAFATENYHSIGFSNQASTSGTSGTSGFVGPDAGGQISVKDLLSQAQDNTRVILTGHIIKRVSHDTYMFTDGTGEVIVEIDHEDMPAEQITPKTLIKIYGKVDKDYYFPAKIEIDVKVVEIQK